MREDVKVFNIPIFLRVTSLPPDKSVIKTTQTKKYVLIFKKIPLPRTLRHLKQDFFYPDDRQLIIQVYKYMIAIEIKDFTPTNRSIDCRTNYLKS